MCSADFILPVHPEGEVTPITNRPSNHKI